MCQVHKRNRPPINHHPLRPSLPEGTNSRIHCDLIGPLPITAADHVYALVMVDSFTKWASVVPLRSKEGGEVANAIINNWYSIFGVPYEIQSDQGPEFCNDLLRRLNELMSVGHRVTTPYYPQANGQVERFNRTLKTSVSIYAESHPSNWDKYINGICWAYNSSLNPQTGFTPFYLTFGREPRLPTDIFHGPVKELRYNILQYGSTLTADLRNAYDIVKENLYKAACEMKLSYDSKIHKPHDTFKRGDKILIYFKWRRKFFRLRSSIDQRIYGYLTQNPFNIR